MYGHGIYGPVFWYFPPTWMPVRSARSAHKKIKSQVGQVRRVFGHAGKFYVI